MRIERTPVTVYDVMGYLVPGLYLVGAAVFFFYYEALLNLLVYPVNQSRIGLVILVISLIIVSGYVVGHIIGLISAETFEALVADFVGYPSSCLLLDRTNLDQSLVVYRRACAADSRDKEDWYHFLMVLLYFPHWLILMLFQFMSLYKLLVKPVGEKTRNLLVG